MDFVIETKTRQPLTDVPEVLSSMNWISVSSAEWYCNITQHVLTVVTLDTIYIMNNFTLHRTL